jgi:hypothetical protein
VAGAVAQSDQTAVGASVAVNVVSRDTQAVIGQLQGVALSNTAGSFSALGSVNLHAQNGGFIGAFAVAGSKAKPSGGADAQPEGKGLPTPPDKGDSSTPTRLDGTDDPGKWPNNQAKYDSVIGELMAKFGESGGSGGGSTSGPGSGSGSGSGSASSGTADKQGKSGMGVSGAVTINVIVDNARAMVRSQRAVDVTGTLTVNALNNAIYGSVAGSVALAEAGEGGSAKALAGAAGVNVVMGTTEALVEGPSRLRAGALDMDATHTGWLVALAAGAAGARGQQGTAVAGSVGATYAAYTVNAELRNLPLGTGANRSEVAGTLAINATDNTNLVQVAGSGAFGGKSGFGAALSFALINNDVNARMANVQGLFHGGAVTVAAEQTSLIVNVVGSVGVGKEDMGVAGMLAVNLITNQVVAEVIGSTNTSDSAGAITVSALNKPVLVTLAGAVGVGAKAGFGGALAYNLITDEIRARVVDSTLRANAVAVTATSDARLATVAVGIGVTLKGGSSDGIAAGGSIAINQISNTLVASVIGSTLTLEAGNGSAGQLNVATQDTSLLVAIGGGVGASISGSAGIGGAIGYNRISNGLLATVSGSKVTAAGAVSVTAQSRPTLVALSGAGSGGKSLALSGTLTLNSIANTIEASIKGGSQVNAGGSVDVRAAESAGLYVVTLAIAAATQGVGVGAALAYNYIGSTIDLADPNALEYADGDIREEGDDRLAAKKVTVKGAETAGSSGVRAYIDSSKVKATGNVRVLAGFEPGQGAPSGLGQGTQLAVNPTTDVQLTGNGNRLTFAAKHGFVTGDEVIYGVTSGGTAIGGLNNRGTYYVIRHDDNTLSLAGSYKEAVHGVAVTLTATGTGEQVLTATDAGNRKFFKAGGQVGEQNVLQTRSVEGDESTTILFDATHGLNEGDLVLYRAETASNTVNGLADGRVYKVLKSDRGDRLRLAAVGSDDGLVFSFSGSDAAANFSLTRLINSSRQSLTAGSTTVRVGDVLAGTVALDASLGLQSGAAVEYREGVLGGKIAGLVDGQTYFLSEVKNVPADRQIAGKTHYRLAATQADAVAAQPKAVVLTARSGSDATLTVKATAINVGGLSAPLPVDFGSQLVSVTAAGAGGKNGAGAGAVNVNLVRMTVSAFISNTSGASTNTVEATTGDVVVRANDASRVGSGTGSVAIGTSSGAAINASIGVNDIRNTVEAFINGTRVRAVSGDVTVGASELAQNVNIVVGGAGSGQGVAAGGSFAINRIQNKVSARIENGADVLAQSDVNVQATDTASIATLAGNVAVSLNGPAGVGVAFAVNVVQNTVEAKIDDAWVKAATGNLTVDALSQKPTQLPPGLDVQIAAMAVSGGAGQNFGGAGSVALNWVRNTVTASVVNVKARPAGTDPLFNFDIESGGALQLRAKDESSIYSLAGAVAVSGFGPASAGGAVGASVAFNSIGDDPDRPGADTAHRVKAVIDKVSGKIKVGALKLEANQTSSVRNITIAGAVAAAGSASFALGGAVSINRIRTATDALITDSGSIDSGAVTVQATNDASIGVLAGGLGVGVARQGGVALAAGVSVAINKITDTTRAQIAASTLRASDDVSVSALNKGRIEALTLGVAVAVSTADGLAGSGAGAGSGNTITSTVKADVSGAASITTTGPNGSLRVTADNEATVRSLAGTLAVSVALGSTGVGASIGVSVADNTISNTVQAHLDGVRATLSGGVKVTAKDASTIQTVVVGGTLAVATAVSVAVGVTEAASRITGATEAWVNASNVSAGRDIEVAATKSATIEAYSVAAAVSIAGGNLGIALAGGGAEARNVILAPVRAWVQDSSITRGGALTVVAEHTATIKAVVVAISGAIGIGGSAGAGAAIGASLARNQIGYDLNAASQPVAQPTDVQSWVQNSQITVSGAVSITAKNTGSITAEVGSGSVAISGSGTGALSLGGSGASADNRTAVRTLAALRGGSNVQAPSVAVTASDSSSLTAKVGAASLAVAVAQGGVSLTVGVALARNTSDNETRALISGSTVKAREGGISVSAVDTATLSGDSVAASVAVGIGLGGVALAGAGADVRNVLLNEVKAEVLQSTLTVSEAKYLVSDAAGTLAQGDLVSDGVQVFRYLGNTRAFGGTTGFNLFQQTFADTALWQRVGGDVSVSATSTASLRSLVGGVAAAVSGGVGAASGAVGMSVSENLIGAADASANSRERKVQASISSSSVRAAGHVRVHASATDSIDAVAFSGSVALAIGIGAGVSSAGVVSTNRFHSDVSATLTNSTVTSGRDVEVRALDRSEITRSHTVGVAVSASVVGLSVAATQQNNLITNQVSASISGSRSHVILSAGTVSVAANDGSAGQIESIIRNVNAVTASVAAGGLAVAGGGIGIANTVANQVSSTVSGVELLAPRVNVLARDEASVASEAEGITLAAGVYGLGLGVAVLDNKVSGSVLAKIDGADVTAGSVTLRAQNFASVPKTLAVAVTAATTAAASGNRASAVIDTLVDVEVNNSRLDVANVLSIEASSTNLASTSANGGALGTAAVGAMVSQVSLGREGNVNEVKAKVSGGSVLTAGTLTVRAYSSDTLSAESVAAGAGALAITGADSSVITRQTTLVTVDGASTLSAVTLALNSQHVQDIDSQADAYTLALAAGSGAGVRNIIESAANVTIGNAILQAGAVTINASNKLDKKRFVGGDNLRSGSASVAGVTALESRTDIGTDNQRFQSVVDIGGAAVVRGLGSSGTPGRVEINAFNEIDAQDGVMMAGVSGFSVSVVRSLIYAKTDARVEVAGLIENTSGRVTLTTRTNDFMANQARLRVANALTGAAYAEARAESDADNRILLKGATVRAGDVRLWAGVDAGGATNQVGAYSDTTILSASLYPNIAAPIAAPKIVERNTIDISGAARVQSLENIDLLAQQPAGAGKRASGNAQMTSLSMLPYGASIKSGSDTSLNRVTIQEGSGSGVPQLVAGLNSQTVVHVLPVSKLPAGLSLANGPRALSVEQVKALTGVDLPQGLEYVAEMVRIDQLPVNIGTGSVVKAANGRYYEYTPQFSGVVAMRIDTIDFASARGWRLAATTDAEWSSIRGTRSAYAYNAGALIAQNNPSLSNAFFVVRPTAVGMPTLTYESMGNVLIEQRTKLLDWIADHAANTEAIARYQVQLQQVNDALRKLGLLSTNPDGSLQLINGQPVADAALDTLFINLPDVYAAPGSIFVGADEVSKAAIGRQLGSQLVAKSGALIDVNNASPFAMKVNDAVVKDTRRVKVIDGNYTVQQPGRVYFNDVAQGSAAGTTAATPQIRIYQEFRTTDSPNLSAGARKLNRDLYIVGDVVNESGSLDISNMNATGSVNVTGDLRAKSVNISSQGDFNLNSADWFHTGFDPRLVLGSDAQRQLARTAAGLPTPSSYKLDSTSLTNALAAQPTSRIVAQGRVAITARYLDINGTVQSGVQNVTLNIAANFQAPTSDVRLTDAGGKAIAGISFGAEGAPVSGYFDAARGQFVLDQITPSGGDISIAGQILNTGLGRLQVANGYASVNINNQSGYNVLVQGIDATTQRVGKITIADTLLNKKTVFEKVGTSVVEQVYDLLARPTDLPKSTVNWNTASNVVYKPKAGTTYVWVEGQGFTQNDTFYKEEKTFNLIGEWAAIPTGNVQWDSRVTVYTDAKPLLESEALAGSGLDAGTGYAIRYEQKTLTSNTNERQWTTGGGWLQEKVFHLRRDVVAGKKDYYNHYLTADRDIGIGFLDGSASPDINITSRGGITLQGDLKVIEGRNVNLSSDRGITSSAGVGVFGNLAVLNAGSVALTVIGSTRPLNVSARGDITLAVAADIAGNSGQAADGILRVGRIESTSGNVSIQSAAGMVAIDASAIVKGVNVQLLATEGNIGTEGQALRVDTGLAGGLAAKARGLVHVQEISGDLRLISPTLWANAVASVESTQGDVRLVSPGDVLKANNGTVGVSEADRQKAREAAAAELTTLYHAQWRSSLGARASGLGDARTVTGVNSEAGTLSLSEADFNALTTGDEVVFSGVRAGASVLNDVSYFVVKGSPGQIGLARSLIDAAVAEQPRTLALRDLTSADVGMVLRKVNYTANLKNAGGEALVTQGVLDRDVVISDERYALLASLFKQGQRYEASYAYRFTAGASIPGFADGSLSRQLFDDVLRPDNDLKGGGASPQTSATLLDVAGRHITISATGQVGRLSGLQSLDLSAGFNTQGLKALSAAEQALLSGAAVSDVVGVFHDLYRYKGAGTPDLTTADFGSTDWERIAPDFRTSTAASSTQVQTGQRVLVETNAEAYGLYEYRGGTQAMNLRNQDYSDSRRWVRLVADQGVSQRQSEADVVVDAEAVAKGKLINMDVRKGQSVRVALGGGTDGWYVADRDLNGVNLAAETYVDGWTAQNLRFVVTAKAVDARDGLLIARQDLPQYLTLQVSDPITLKASGDVQLQSGRGATLASAEDLRLGSMDVTGDLRIKSGQSITTTSVSPIIVRQGDLSLTAATLVRASNGQALRLQMVDGGTVSVQAQGDIDLLQVSNGQASTEGLKIGAVRSGGGQVAINVERGDLQLGLAKAHGDVTLTALAGNLVNAFDDASLERPNAWSETGRVILSATQGAVGSGSNALQVRVDQGHLTGFARDDAYLRSATALTVRGFIAGMGSLKVGVSGGKLGATDVQAGRDLGLNSAGDLRVRNALAGQNVVLQSNAQVDAADVTAQAGDITVTSEGQQGSSTLLNLQAAANLLVQTRAGLEATSLRAGTGRAVFELGGNARLSEVRAAIDVVGRGLGVSGLRPSALTLNRVTADAGDVRFDVAGDLRVDSVQARKGRIELSADGSILNARSDTAPTLVARSLTLLARMGSIGTALTPLYIDSSNDADGTVTATAAGVVRLVETQGDLRVARIASATDDVALTAAQSIVDALGGDAAKVLGRRVTLQALAGTIGSEAQALEIDSQAIDVGRLFASASGDIVVTEVQGALLAGQVVSQQGNVTLMVRDSAASGEDFIADASSQVLALSGLLVVRAGDDVRTLANSLLSARSTAIKSDQGDTGKRDGGGSRISIAGYLRAAMNLISGGRGDDYIELRPQELVGWTRVTGDDDGQAGGNDTIFVDRLPGMVDANGRRTQHARVDGGSLVDDSLDLDGRSGADTYIVQVASGLSDHVINVKDTGAELDGVNDLTVLGTKGNDNFLLRRNFVALLTPAAGTGYAQQVQRINYDTSITGRLSVLGVDGSDRFTVDDNSAITTLDAGMGRADFQFGQMFGSDPKAALGNVALGDDIATVETTVGFLSRGVSFATTAYGGKGDNQFRVYSNAAELKLIGGEGDDNFVVRAFVLKDNSGISTSKTTIKGGSGSSRIEYNVNAPVSIDGGAGINSVVIVGTEKDDNFVITRDGVQGAGLNTRFTNIQKLEVDGLEGNDHFYVLSTHENMVTTLIGGAGNNTFNVGGDVMGRIVALNAKGASAFVNHSLTSQDPDFNGVFAEGVSLTVAGASASPVVVKPSNGGTQVVRNGTAGSNRDTYTVQLAMPAPSDPAVVYLTVSAAMPATTDQKRIREQDPQASATLLEVSLDGQTWSQSLILAFDPTATDLTDAHAWAREQTIHVRAVGDQAQIGERTVVISHAVRSDNTAFQGLLVPNLEARVIDANTPGLIVTEAMGGTRVLSGGSSSYDLRLTRAPAAGETVTVQLKGDAALLALAAADSSQATRFSRTAIGAEVRFDASNWSQNFRLEVQGQTPSNLFNPQTTQILHTVVSSDAQQGIYRHVAQADAPAVQVLVRDSRVGSLVVQGPSGDPVAEGQPQTYSLALSKAPSEPVTVTLSGDGKTLFGVAGSNTAGHGLIFEDAARTRLKAVVFDATNWNQAFAVEVRANPDADLDVGKQPVQLFPAQAHLVNAVRGPLIIEGGALPNRDRTLGQPVMLPTERDAGVQERAIDTDTTQSTQTLNVFNDGSAFNDQGRLSGLGQHDLSGLGSVFGNALLQGEADRFGVLTGLGMGEGLTLQDADSGRRLAFGGGITYHGVDVVNVLLGEGNDTFTVEATAVGSLTAVHGGGGDNTLIATGGGGALAPLFLFGSTSQDGQTYNSTTEQLTGGARLIRQVGNNTIDASANRNGVVIYGGSGHDRILGSQGDDIIAGGSGNDTISAGLGRDQIWGDAGLNIDLSLRLSQMTVDALKVVNVAPATDDPRLHDALQAGDDRIDTRDGDDVVLADFGDIIQADGVNRVLRTDQVVRVESTVGQGRGDNTLVLGAGNSLALGGAGRDEISVGAGSSVLLGDVGRVDMLNDGTRVTVVTTAFTPDEGSDDTLLAASGSHLLVGGFGADQLSAGAGTHILLGDNGRVDLNAQGQRASTQTLDTQRSTGGNDAIAVGLGQSLVLAGVGSDTVRVAAGNHVVLGDNGSVVWSPEGDNIASISSSLNDSGLGDADLIEAGNGRSVLIGGVGADTLRMADGAALVVGDGAVVQMANGRWIRATTVQPTVGADDVLQAGNGNMVLLGGAGNDQLIAGNGNNVLLGDHGDLLFDDQGNPLRIEATDPLTGGDDRLVSGSGRTIAMGGNGKDSLVSGAGDDVLIGDSGRALLANDVLVRVETIDLLEGDADTLDASSGFDVIMGGAGSDLLYGSLSTDVLVGDYASTYFGPTGQSTKVERFGFARNAPDLIARTQDAVFTSPQLRVALSSVGGARGAGGASTFSAQPMPRITLEPSGVWGLGRRANPSMDGVSLGSFGSRDSLIDMINTSPPAAGEAEGSPAAQAPAGEAAVPESTPVSEPSAAPKQGDRVAPDAGQGELPADDQGQQPNDATKDAPKVEPQPSSKAPAELEAASRAEPEDTESADAAWLAALGLPMALRSGTAVGPQSAAKVLRLGADGRLVACDLRQNRNRRVLTAAQAPDMPAPVKAPEAWFDALVSIQAEEATLASSTERSVARIQWELTEERG